MQCLGYLAMSAGALGNPPGTQAVWRVAEEVQRAALTASPRQTTVGIAPCSVPTAPRPTDAAASSPSMTWLTRWEQTSASTWTVRDDQRPETPERGREKDGGGGRVSEVGRTHTDTLRHSPLWAALRCPDRTTAERLVLHQPVSPSPPPLSAREPPHCSATPNTGSEVTGVWWSRVTGTILKLVIVL